MSEQKSPNSESHTSGSECSDSCCSIRRLACRLRDAVVAISGQTVTGSISNPSITIVRGNGFFIKGHYIICPADLVLMNSSLARTNARIPAFPGIPSGARYPNALIRASKIIVAVSNVNGSGHSYSYEADIVGIDGAANIAILRINMGYPWNKCNPCIEKNHPYLHWGKSRNTCPGDTIMVIGDITNGSKVGISNANSGLMAENAVAVGNIADNRYVFPGGAIPGELLLLSNILFPSGTSQGLPVITCDGKVVGMVVYTRYTNGGPVFPANIALSEFFMRRPIKALLNAYQTKCISRNYDGFVEYVLDPIGDYLRFNKAWLGVGGILMSQDDYDTTISTTILSTTGSTGAVSFARAPLLLNGQVWDGPNCKEIVGFRVLAVAGTSVPTNVFVPGTSPALTFVPDLPASPALGLISSGDIITHVNGCPLGDRKGQISPSLVMWRVRPGDVVKIQYRKQSDLFKNCYEISVCTRSYEPFLDQPFYSSGLFSPASDSMLPTLL